MLETQPRAQENFFKPEMWKLWGGINQPTFLFEFFSNHFISKN